MRVIISVPFLKVNDDFLTWIGESRDSPRSLRGGMPVHRRASRYNARSPQAAKEAVPAPGPYIPADLLAAAVAASASSLLAGAVHTAVAEHIEVAQVAERVSASVAVPNALRAAAVVAASVEALSAVG